MKSLLTVLVSVIVSLIADFALDTYMFNNDDSTSKNSNPNGVDDKKYNEVVKSISKLNNQINSVDKNINTKFDNLQAELEKVKVTANTCLENFSKGNDTAKVLADLTALLNRVEALEKQYGSTDNTTVQQQQQQIDALTQLVIKQDKRITELSNAIQALQSNSNAEMQHTTPIVLDKPISASVPVPVNDTVKVSIDSDVVIPNEDYVKKLIENLDKLSDKLGDREYTRCKEDLNKVLDDGDFDDADDIMQVVHGALEKYIYKSDSKVSLDDWKYLEQYLMDAGYKPINANVGDSIKDYAKYFEHAIPASDSGISGTIKIITQRPYVIKYLADDNVEQLKLCGKCTIYK